MQNRHFGLHYLWKDWVERLETVSALRFDSHRRRTSERNFSRGYEGRYRALKSYWAPMPYWGPCHKIIFRLGTNLAQNFFRAKSKKKRSSLKFSPNFSPKSGEERKKNVFTQICPKNGEEQKLNAAT